MLRTKLILATSLLLIGLAGTAQSVLDTLLRSIETNNKTLIAERQRQVADVLAFRTGNTLPNPRLEGEYLFGSPSTAGDQVDFIAIQGFEFPAVYSRRRELADSRGEVAARLFAARRQAILLEARSVCLEMVYRNKLGQLLDRRFRDVQTLVDIFTRRLDTGEGSILDLNKARIQFLEVSQLREENVQAQMQLRTRLAVLNGSKPVELPDTLYPTLGDVGTASDLRREVLAADPRLRLYQEETRVTEKELAVGNMQRAPSFEAGYHYQGILGQRFSGIHLGMTIPVWAHKYRRQQQEAEILQARLAAGSYGDELATQAEAEYERVIRMRETLSAFTSAMVSASDMNVLNKALARGEMSTTEYFLEAHFLQGAAMHYLKLEHDFYQAVAHLLRHRL